MRNLIALFVLAAAFIGGCTTDQPILTRQRESRREGVTLYNRADYENAAGAFRNAIKQDPRDHRSNYYLGLTYERLNNFQQAVQCYKSSLKVMRETPAGRADVDFRQIVMNTLASCIARQDANNLEQTLLSKLAADAKSGSRERAENYFLLAKIERYRRDADSALASYYKASELDRDDFWLQKEAGLYILKMGKANQAVKSVQRANRLNGRDEEVRAAMQQLKLALPSQLQPTYSHEVVQAFGDRPLPAVDLKIGDSPVTLPDQLPID